MTETNDELRQAYEEFDRCCRALKQAVDATRGPMTETRRLAMQQAVGGVRQRKANAELRLRGLLEIGWKEARGQWLSQTDGRLYAGQTFADAIGRLKPKAARLVDMAFNAGWLAARNASVGEIVKLRRQVEQANAKAEKAKAEAEELEIWLNAVQRNVEFWRDMAKGLSENAKVQSQAEKIEMSTQSSRHVDEDNGLSWNVAPSDTDREWQPNEFWKVSVPAGWSGTIKLSPDRAQAIPAPWTNPTRIPTFKSVEEGRTEAMLRETHAKIDEADAVLNRPIDQEEVMERFAGVTGASTALILDQLRKLDKQMRKVGDGLTEALAIAESGSSPGWQPGAKCTYHGIIDCLNCREMGPDKWAKPEEPARPREIAEAEAKMFCWDCGERHKGVEECSAKPVPERYGQGYQYSRGPNGEAEAVPNVELTNMRMEGNSIRGNLTMTMPTDAGEVERIGSFLTPELEASIEAWKTRDDWERRFDAQADRVREAHADMMDAAACLAFPGETSLPGLKSRLRAARMEYDEQSVAFFGLLPGQTPTGGETGTRHPDDSDAENAEAVIEQALTAIRSGSLGEITRAIVVLAEVEGDGSVGTTLLRTATKNQLETLGLLAAALDEVHSFPTIKPDRE
jgi:hypothetical protein